MAKETQISAQISVTTRELMEKHVRRTGVKKGHLIEQALLHHLQALDELPAEFVVHPRLVVSKKTGEGLVRDARSAEPTPALRKLMRHGDWGTPSERRGARSRLRDGGAETPGD